MTSADGAYDSPSSGDGGGVRGQGEGRRTPPTAPDWLAVLVVLICGASLGLIAGANLSHHHTHTVTHSVLVPDPTCARVFAELQSNWRWEKRALNAYIEGDRHMAFADAAHTGPIDHGCGQ
jgi:hypothetical protein